jgi:hypothetical protein
MIAAGARDRRSAMSVSGLEKRLAELKRRLAEPSLGDDLRRSLEARPSSSASPGAARPIKFAFLEAELARIEGGRSASGRALGDPDHLSQRIDEISATLGTTGEWIADQQKTIGAMDDLISEPPTLAAQTRARELN